MYVTVADLWLHTCIYMHTFVWMLLKAVYIVAVKLTDPACTWSVTRFVKQLAHFHCNAYGDILYYIHSYNILSTASSCLCHYSGKLYLLMYIGH